VVFSTVGRHGRGEDDVEVREGKKLDENMVACEAHE
jgi:hypothetical protein